MHVRTRLVRRRHPIDRANRLAVHEDDALVALSDIRQILLNNERFTEDSLEKLHKRPGIRIVGRTLKTAAPPFP